MKLFTHLFLFSLVLHCTAAISNDNRHPRAMMKHDDSLKVISFLSQNTYASLPAGIYASAQTSLPAGNITPSDRRARATLAKNAAFCLYMGVTHTGTYLRPLSQEEKQQLLQTIIQEYKKVYIYSGSINLRMK